MCWGGSSTVSPNRVVSRSAVSQAIRENGIDDLGGIALAGGVIQLSDGVEEAPPLLPSPALHQRQRCSLYRAGGRPGRGPRPVRRPAARPLRSRKPQSFLTGALTSAATPAIVR